MLRLLFWRLVGVLAVIAGFALLAWFVDGGPGKVLRGSRAAGRFHITPSAVDARFDRLLVAV
ncbi:MAG TPA: hypothetical protein VIH71_02560, partial [Solirubrobacteraceae bacterium]